MIDIISTGKPLITSGYGWRFLGGVREHHDGIDIVDIQRQERTEDVYALAIADGVVNAVHKGASIGNAVDIAHDGNMLTRYYHFKNRSKLNVGDRVRAGDKVGILGTTGNSTGIHLHFAIKRNSTAWNNGTYVDPMPYLKGELTIDEVKTKPLQIGDAIGKVYYTDIKAFINDVGVPIQVANEKTLVIVEQLDSYGFSVAWNAEARELTANRVSNKKFKPLIVTVHNEKSGAIKCDYLYTDIKTYIGGNLTESYAINGQTLIDIEFLGSKYGYNKWDDNARAISVYI